MPSPNWSGAAAPNSTPCWCGCLSANSRANWRLAVRSNYEPLPPFFHTLAASERDCVLLQTSRFDPQNYRSYLFARPLRVLAVEDPGELPALFEEIEGALAQGLFAAGFLT